MVSKWDRNDDFLVINALRYAMGHRTYITPMTAEWIKANFDYLSIQTRTILHRDLTEFLSRESDLGDQYDIDAWLSLYEFMCHVEPAK
jgi:hypothetical protein